MYKKYIEWKEYITNKEIADFLGFTERAIYKYKKKNNETENDIDRNNNIIKKKELTQKKGTKIKDEKNKIEDNKKYNVYSSAKLALFLYKNKENLKKLKLKMKEIFSIINTFCDHAKHEKNILEDINEVLFFLELLEKYINDLEDKEKD